MFEMTTPVAILRDGAFKIEGRGTALLSGISANETCPFRLGQMLFFRAPNGNAKKAQIKAVEYALIKTSEEQYGLIFDPKELAPGDAPQGTAIFVSNSPQEK